MKKAILKLRNPILFIAVIAILGKMVIYLVELLIAIKFGASRITDAFILARSIPVRIGSIANWALYSAFMPFYLKILNDNKDSARALSLRFFKNILLVSFVVSLFLALGSDFILKIFAPGFDHATFLLSSKLLKIMSWSILFGSTAAIFQSINASHDHQLTASVVQPLNNFVILLSILGLAYYFGIYAVALGVLLGSFSKLFIQFIPKNRLKEFLSNRKQQINVSITAIWKLFILIVSISLIREVMMIIARVFASHYEGDVSILNYGYVIAQAPLLVIETLTIYIFYPFFITRSISADSNEFKITILKFIRTVFFIIIPISVVMIVLSGLIAKVLFLHGKFNWLTTDKTATAIAFFSLGILGMAVDSIAFRVAIISRMIKRYSFLLITRLIINVLLNAVLIKYLSPVIALSLAFSLASIFNAILLMLYIGGVINHRFNFDFLKFITKVILSSMVVGGVVFGIKWGCSNLSYLNGFLPRLTVLSITLIIGAGIYLLLAYSMNMKEFQWIKALCIKKAVPEITDV